MITDLLRESWERIPPDMALDISYGGLLDSCCERLYQLQENHCSTATSTLSGIVSLETAESARKLYLAVPGIINVMLNYKICMYYQLPLHPTRYFEVPEVPGLEIYAREDVDRAEALFEKSVQLALAFYKLDMGALDQARRFRTEVPPHVLDFIYTSKPDNYTWQGSDPRKIQRLADSVLSRGKPDLIIGAAHGALMAGLVLALMLDVPVWFLRFSMFKRSDRGPVVTPYDARFLSHFSNADVLALDEDSASGQTLGILSERLAGLGLRPRTGAVIRHGASKFRPDHAGFVWWE